MDSGMLQSDAGIEAQRLMDLGYRRTSSRHCHISRIDRADWIERMARDFGDPVERFFIPGTTVAEPQWCDQYRRVYSKDTLTVPFAVSRLIRTSGFDPVGFVAPQEN